MGDQNTKLNGTRLTSAMCQEQVPGNPGVRAWRRTMRVIGRATANRSRGRFEIACCLKRRLRRNVHLLTPQH